MCKLTWTSATVWQQRITSQTLKLEKLGGSLDVDDKKGLAVNMWMGIVNE